MATIKSFTTLEQSKKLAEILPIESADNVIVSIGDREGVKTIIMPKETLNILRTPFTDIRNTTPCWSLAALLGVLPYPFLSELSNGIWKCGYYPSGICNYVIADSPIDACYEMILKLHKLNLL